MKATQDGDEEEDEFSDLQSARNTSLSLPTMTRPAGAQSQPALQTGEKKQLKENTVKKPEEEEDEFLDLQSARSTRSLSSQTNKARETSKEKQTQEEDEDEFSDLHSARVSTQSHTVSQSKKESTPTTSKTALKQPVKVKENIRQEDEEEDFADFDRANVSPPPPSKSVSVNATSSSLPLSPSVPLSSMSLSQTLAAYCDMWREKKDGNRAFNTRLNQVQPEMNTFEHPMRACSEFLDCLSVLERRLCCLY